MLFVFFIQVNAQTAIQEFDFNGTLTNANKSVLFTGTAKFVSDRAGVANNAIRVTSPLEVNIPNLPLSNASRTVSIWVKYNDVSSANYLWGYGKSINTQYFGLLQQRATNFKSDLNLASWGPSNDIIVSTAITTGMWYNYTVTYDGLTSKIYRNGDLIKSSISPRKLTSSADFVIGKVGSVISINADIDDLKIYDVALTAKEVADLYGESSNLVTNDNVFADSSMASNGAANKDTGSKTSVKSLKPTATGKSKIVLSDPIETLPNKASEIFTPKGVKVYSSDNSKIDITNLPEGSYLLKVTKSSEGDLIKKITAN